MNKVKLPKEVAEAIETLRNPENGFSDYAIIGMLYSHTHHKELDSIQILNSHMGQDKMHPDNLITALVNGYEVEETPEDKVRAWYELFNQSENKTVFNALEVQGIIEKTLNLLNIKIEGVNT